MLTDDTRAELTSTLPAILDIPEVAKFLRCSILTVRRLIWDKQLGAYMTEGQWNINRDDLIQYLDDHSSL